MRMDMRRAGAVCSTVLWTCAVTDSDTVSIDHTKRTTNNHALKCANGATDNTRRVQFADTIDGAVGGTVGHTDVWSEFDAYYRG